MDNAEQESVYGVREAGQQLRGTETVHVYELSNVLGVYVHHRW